MEYIYFGKIRNRTPHFSCYLYLIIDRNAKTKLQELAAVFKVVAVTGPRQSGKTTLVKAIFKQKPYLSLENPDTRSFALEDPRGFLKKYPEGAVLDEVQRAPELFSYLQEILDNSSPSGLFILTGSNNFLLQQNIVQTLAGRIAFINLLPFSLHELYPGETEMPGEDKIMLTGLYPPIHDRSISPEDWFPNYIRTYIERDVRQIKNITDLIFYDTGLICSLLGITSEIQLSNHPLRGSIFESLIVSEFIKKRTNAGKTINLYYWRDKTGREIDIIIDNAGQLTPVEIKSGKTINAEFFKNILYWNALSGEKQGYLI